jgi:hypothetical protein
MGSSRAGEVACACQESYGQKRQIKKPTVFRDAALGVKCFDSCALMTNRQGRLPQATKRGPGFAFRNRGVLVCDAAGPLVSERSLRPDESMPGLEDPRTTAAGQHRSTMTTDFSPASGTSAPVLGRRPRHLRSKAALPGTANRDGDLPPRGPMAGTPGCQRMGDFVEDRLPNLLLRIQGNEVPGEGDLPFGVVACAEPDLGMVEMKRPLGPQSCCSKSAIANTWACWSFILAIVSSCYAG